MYHMIIYMKHTLMIQMTLLLHGTVQFKGLENHSPALNPE